MLDLTDLLTHDFGEEVALLRAEHDSLSELQTLEFANSTSLVSLEELERECRAWGIELVWERSMRAAA